MSSNDSKTESLEARQDETEKPVNRQLSENSPEEKQEGVKPDNHDSLGLKGFWHAISGRLQRTRNFFPAALVRMRDAGSGLLRRLKKRGVEADEGDTEADERHAERQPRKEKKPLRDERVKTETPQEATPQAPRSGVHNLIINLLVLVIGTIAGMTFSFTLLSSMVFNQANRINDQREDIGQLEKQVSRIMESEAKYRKENNELQKRLSEMEATAAAQNAAKEAPLAESAASSAPHSTGKQSQAKKTGDCKLDAGNLGGNLNRCIDEFNRK